MQMIAMLLQVRAPPSKSRSNLKNCVRQQGRPDSRQNAPKPLARRFTPRLRPFLSRRDPFVIRFDHRAFSFQLSFELGKRNHIEEFANLTLPSGKTLL